MMAGDDDERRGACELPPITPRGGERLVSPRPPSHPPEASSRGGRAVVAGGKFRRDTLELLEERWKNRKAPATRESAAPSPRFFKMSSSPALPLPVSTAVDGDASAWVERQLEQVKLFASTQIASSTQQAESVRIVSKLLVQLKEGKLDAGEKEPSESDAQEHDHEREMAEFQAMMAGNDLEAAEKKLADIIAAAEEDGEIDENEQAQIDQAKEHLRAMQEKKRAAERLQEELERKAAEKAELAALMASNDVKAAEKKLQEIIAAAEEDGEIDEDERKEIERAKDELETLKKKKERLDKKMKTTREQVEVKKLPAHREEKVRISIAAKQTAQERLRLATELRALKEKYTELATDYKKQISDMEQIEEAFALALIELETSKGMVAEQRRELAEKGQEIESLKKDQDRLKVEVDKYTQLANVRKTQLVELKQAFDSVRAQWEKENNVLSSQLATVSQRMSSVTRELEEERKEKVKLERSSRNNEELARLEKDAAMLERTNGDKLRIRCIELDEEIHELVRACARSGIPLTPQQQTRCSQLERELAKVEGDNSSLKEHLQEAALWHQARVAARPTTKKLLMLPVDAQEVTMPQCNLNNFDAIMVAEFLINNLMIVSCDLSKNEITEKGATALAQALVSNRVLTSLSLKDNLIGPAGARRLSEMLYGNRSLERLNLMGCEVGDEGCLLLCEALEKSQCTLQNLALRFNSISDVGATGVGKMLEVNRSLTELGLNNNNITDKGVLAISVALAKNESLKLLRMTECPIGGTEGKHFMRADMGREG